jgi:hypothetical protein
MQVETKLISRRTPYHCPPNAVCNAMREHGNHFAPRPKTVTAGLNSSFDDFSLDCRRVPLVSRTPLSVEVVLEVDTVLEDRVILSPIFVAVLEDLTDISLELRARSILVSVHLGLNGAKVHGTLDNIEVVGDVVDGGVNGVLEGSDEASPEAGALEHAGDEITAVLHLLLSGEGNGLSCDLSGDTAVVAGTAIWFRLTSSLLDGRRLDLNRLISERGSRSCDFGLAAALCGGTWLLNVNLSGVEMKLMLLTLRCVGRCGREITHDNDKLTEDFLGERLCKGIANLRGSAHFSG